MSEQTFNIVFSGELVGGADPARVRENLGKLFKMDAARVEALFSGKPVVIKKNADQATAMKFRAALRQAGAQCQMVPVGGEAAADASATPAASPGKASFESRDPSPQPAPEPAAPTAAPAAPEPEASTSAASQAPAQPAATPAEAAETSQEGGAETVGTIRTGGTGFSGKFDVAPVGADMEQRRDGPPPIDPDISHLSMAEPGADLEELKQEKEIKVPDISHLSVVPDGNK